jgi:hypothetical protein
MDRSNWESEYCGKSFLYLFPRQKYMFAGNTVTSTISLTVPTETPPPIYLLSITVAEAYAGINGANI